MKVGLVLEQFDLRRGGAEQWTRQFAVQLLARGHEVHVVAERFSEEVQALPIVTHRLPRVRSRLAFAEAAQAKLRSLRPEVIHDMGSGWYCDVFHPHGGSWASVSERKLLLQPRWMRPLKQKVDRLLPRQRGYQALMSRQYADNGQVLVALSRAVADDFRCFHKVANERIRMVYNGVDTDRFSPANRAVYRAGIRGRLGVGDQTVLCLIVTHNFRLKGVPTLLRAIARLHARDAPVHLIVVGGKRVGGYVRAAERLGIGDVVTFVGRVDDPVPYYAAADLYAHPTFYDPCSLVVLEALASGLPVVTSSYDGAGELIGQGTEGFVVSDPADTRELVGRLEILLEQAVRQRMGRAARQLALKHTLRRNVDEILAVYDEAVGGRARSTTSLTPSEPAVSARGQRCLRVSGARRPAAAVAAVAATPAMKIGLAIEYFDPRRGGAEQWTFRFAQRLLALGHEVHVVSQDFSPATERLPIVAHRLGKLRSRLGFAAAAQQELNSLALDVVHDMGAGWCGDVFMSHDGSRLAQWDRKLVLLPRWARPVKRLLIRVLPRYHKFQELFTRQFADRRRIVVAMSKMVARDYRHYHAVPAEQIRLVYHGVDTEQFSPDRARLHRDAVRRQLDVHPDELLLAFVGHDFRRKGLATAVRAVGRLGSEGRAVRLLVIGGKPNRRYTRLSRRRGAGGAVTFTGPTNDPALYYAAADVLVLPTFYDPFGLVVLEAAACGLPVITTRYAGVSELMADGVEGYVLADPADDAALADRLRALGSSGLRARMGEAARRLALEYPLSRNCDEIVAIYRDVVHWRRHAA